MFDISWGEMLVVGVVALVVIGPKELPGVIRTLGRSVNKLRGMAGDFRAQFDEAMREADLQNVAKDFNDLKNSTTGMVQDTLNPIRDDVEKTIGEARDFASEASGAKAMTQSLLDVEREAASLEGEIQAAAPVSAFGDGPAATPLPLEAGASESAAAKPRQPVKAEPGDAA